jgi:chromosome segregation ATPase
VLQEGPFDLTRHVPPWLLALGWLAFGAYALYRFVRKANRAEDGERAADIEKAVRPHREVAENAERIKGQYREELEVERRAHGECEKRAERLEQRLEIETAAKDELQEKVMRLLARLEKAEGRIEILESR